MDISEDLLCSAFNYKVQTNEEKDNDKFDPSRAQYNNLYKSYEFYEKKFPQGYENIPNFNKIIEYIVENNNDNSPLKEYNNRILS